MAESKTDYYDAVVKSIRLHYNEYTGSDNTYAVTSLLLIDHRPVVRWINGIPYHAYVMVSNPDFWVVYKKKNSSHLDKDIRKVAPTYRDCPLKDFLAKYESSYHLRGWASIEEIMPNVSQLMPNHVEFDCCLKDLDAISLVTDEYTWISRIAMDPSYSGTHQIYGMDFPPSIESKFCGKTSFANWIKMMYLNYMMSANLDLLEYYVRNYRRLKVYGAFSTVYWFTEFVPCLLQITNIYNPMMQPDMIKMLRVNFMDWMAEMLAQPEAPSVHGSRISFEKSEDIAVYYTNRAAVQKITGYSAAPDAGRTKSNLYSPKYLMGQVYSAIWGPLNQSFTPPPMFYEGNIRWHCLVKDDVIMGFSPIPMKVPEGYTSFDCSYGEMLFMEMLASVYEYNRLSLINRFMVIYHPVTIEDIKKAGIRDE